MTPRGQDRLNNFDALRLIGAILVIVGHAHPLHGLPAEPRLWGMDLSRIGLAIFFSVSGYLITQSWSRDRRLIAYLWKRSLRIFPGLLVAVLFCMVVVGVMTTRLPLTEYVGRSSFWQFLSNAVLSPVYALPGVFEGQPYPVSVNGSLWSLPVEFSCYLLVPLVSLAPARVRSVVWVLLGIGSGVLSLALVEASTRIVFWGTDLAQATGIWGYFMIAAALAERSNAVLGRLDVSLIALAGASIVTAVVPAINSFVWWLVLPPVITTLGAASTPLLRRAGRYGDFSYGLYLYAFPVQQSLIHFAPTLRFSVSVLFTLLITAVLAALSWWLIESRALRLKPRAPRPPAGPPAPGGSESPSAFSHPLGNGLPWP